jgi:dihydroxyacetone kinase-like protein
VGSEDQQVSDALSVAWALAWIRGTQAVLAENRETLNDLDRAIGDGDHGENMDRGFKAVVVKLADGSEDVQSVLKLVASTLMSTVGGAAGPLYGTAFLRAAKAADGGDLDVHAVVGVIAGALEGIVARGKATTGEKTMVDAWTPALDAAKAVAESGGSPAAALRAAADAAAKGAEDTIPLQATKGRASYLGERSIGHKDPGATSTALILNVAADAAEAA